MGKHIVFVDGQEGTTGLRIHEYLAARSDIDGTDLLALVSALAWLNDQPPFASRVEHLFGVIAGAIMGAVI